MRKMLLIIFLFSLMSGFLSAQPAHAQLFSENFDSYSNGSQMHGQGGWKGWNNNPAAGALVTNTHSLSLPNSVEIAGLSDLVHEFSGADQDIVTLTAWQYIPSDFNGTTYFILLNTYTDSGSYNWSTQLKFDSATDMVSSDADGNNLPLIYGQWVQIRVVINHLADTQDIYYNGQHLVSKSWTDGMNLGGVQNLAAIDLCANNSASIYYDDISVSTSSNSLSINDMSLSEGNSGTTTFPFTVSLSSPAGAGGVTFDIATADNTATAPSDYTARSLTGQTIPQGSSTYTFDVLVNGDTTFETNETFFVNVTNVTGATVADGQGMGMINNDDVLIADLAITKTDTPDTVTPGINLTYTITLSNNGPDAAASAVFSDALPSGTTFVSLTPAGGWSCSTPAVGAGGTVSCSIASFSAGSAVFTLVVNVAPSVTGGTIITNTATVSATTSDPNSANNSATTTTTAAYPVSVTIPAATGNGDITLQTSSAGCGFTSYGVKTEAQVANDSLYEYPYGLVEFTLNCESADVTITFPGDISGTQYRKYGPTTPGNAGTTAWYNFSGTIAGNQITLHLQDNALGDDTGDDGIIVDQGGPGQQPIAAVAVPTINEWGMIIFMALAGLATVYYLRRQRRA